MPCKSRTLLVQWEPTEYLDWCLLQTERQAIRPSLQGEAGSDTGEEPLNAMDDNVDPTNPTGVPVAEGEEAMPPPEDAAAAAAEGEQPLATDAPADIPPDQGECV